MNIRNHWYIAKLYFSNIFKFNLCLFMKIPYTPAYPSLTLIYVISYGWKVSTQRGLQFALRGIFVYFSFDHA